MHNCRPLCAKRNAEDRLNLLKLLKDGAIFCSERYPEDAEIIDMEIRKQLGEDIPEVKGKTASTSAHPSKVKNERTEVVVESLETKETICQKASDSTDTKTGVQQQIHTVPVSQENHQAQCPAVATQTEVADKVLASNASSGSAGNVKMQDIWLPIFGSITWNMENICKE